VVGSAVDFLDPQFEQTALRDVRAELGRRAEEMSSQMSDFACTMLAAVVADDAAVFLQIGDGAIVYRCAGEDASWRLALSPQRGEFANETVFVTRSDADRRISALRVSGHVLEFALMTDGVEFLAVQQATGVPHTRFFEHVFLGLRASGRLNRDDQHAEWLEHFLSSPQVTARVDDDLTLVLCSRVPSGGG